MYGFAKAKRRNINEKELRIFKKWAKILVSKTDEKIRDDLRKRDLIEVPQEA